MEIDYSIVSRAQMSKSKAVLCIIVSTTGSTPRGVGSKMLYYSNGKTEGTVGGGAIEFQTIEAAKKIVQIGGSQLLTVSLSDGVGGVCGGSATIYLEKICNRESLYIFGSGHVGRAIAQFAANLDFDVFVVDARKEQLEMIEDVSNISKVNCDFVESLDKLDFDNDSYFVITTPNHSFDQVLLGRLLKFPHKYIGMMASKAKIRELTQNLLSEGCIKEDDLQNVDMPIGLPFVTNTPEEIAVSVVARLIDVRNGGTSMKDNRR